MERYISRFVRSQAKLRRCVKAKGGKCYECQKPLLDEPWDVAFHHPGTKHKEISQLLQGNWDDIEHELENCVLLCETCHRKTHFNTAMYHEQYQSICEHEDRIQRGKWLQVNTDDAYAMAKKGMSSAEIAATLGRDERVVRRSIRRIEERTGEKLLPTKSEWIRKNTKITDDEIIACRKVGMTGQEICKQYGLGEAALSRRITKLLKRGLLEKRRN